MLTKKQKAVISYAREHGNKITKKEAMSLIDNHYCNGDKHVGDVLSRMVKASLLIRIKPGCFELGKGKRNKTTSIIFNQPDLFI